MSELALRLPVGHGVELVTRHTVSELERRFIAGNTDDRDKQVISGFLSFFAVNFVEISKIKRNTSSRLIDKEAAVPPPCFTVTVIPAEETLESYLTRHGAKLTVFYVESQQLWELEAPRMGGTCCNDKTLEGAVDKLCRVISGCVRNTKLIPGDIVSKIMASLPSTSR